MAGQAARCRPFVPATPPPQVHPFAIRTRRSARPGSRELPLRLRQADRRARASRTASSPDALHAEGDRTAVRAHSQGTERLWQGGDGGISLIRHACEHLRSHAHGSNSLARGRPIRPEGNFLLRQCCAPVRRSRSTDVPWPLTPLETPDTTLRTPTHTTGYLSLELPMPTATSPQPLVGCRPGSHSLHPRVPSIIRH